MVSNEELQKNIPLFVKDDSPHNCGKCAYRMGDSGCILVEGQINMARGTCAYWAPGDGLDKPMPMRMTKEEAQYLETENKIECGSCRFFNNLTCQLWSGDPVNAEDCCIAYSPTITKNTPGQWMDKWYK